MGNPPNIEQVGPQARIQAELVRLESQKRDFWVLIIFAGVVLFLGVLTFFFPHRFWYGGGLHINFSPQVLFVIMVATVLASLGYVRRDIEVRKLRLANIQQYMSSQQEQANSFIDAVTNVFTRGFLRDLMAGEISRAERTNRSLALIMCDLNNFKQVNDRYGHLMGDYVLSQIAAILKSCVRGSDFVVRYGGDEFLLLLPETDQAGGEPISVSLGLYLHVTGQTPDKDVAEADARMYAEKQAGKRAAAGASAPLPQ
jgi:GGDEF domain-containing protein